jgi:hypothetical protein
MFGPLWSVDARDMQAVDRKRLVEALARALDAAGAASDTELTTLAPDRLVFEARESGPAAVLHVMGDPSKGRVRAPADWVESVLKRWPLDEFEDAAVALDQTGSGASLPKARVVEALRAAQCSTAIFERRMGKGFAAIALGPAVFPTFGVGVTISDDAPLWFDRFASTLRDLATPPRYACVACEERLAFVMSSMLGDVGRLRTIDPGGGRPVGLSELDARRLIDSGVPDGYAIQVLTSSHAAELQGDGFRAEPLSNGTTLVSFGEPSDWLGDSEASRNEARGALDRILLRSLKPA